MFLLGLILIADESQPSETIAELIRADHHDLLADVGKQQVMADIQAWIDAHVGADVPPRQRELRP